MKLGEVGDSRLVWVTFICGVITTENCCNLRNGITVTITIFDRNTQFYCSDSNILLSRLKLKICEDFRSKDIDWRSWTHIPCSLIYFYSILPGKEKFIFQLFKIAHKIWNHLFITSILSFHCFVSFLAILTKSSYEY